MCLILFAIRIHKRIFGAYMKAFISIDVDKEIP